MTWRRLWWHRRDVHHHGRWARRRAADPFEVALEQRARLGEVR